MDFSFCSVWISNSFIMKIQIIIQQTSHTIRQHIPNNFISIYPILAYYSFTSQHNFIYSLIDIMIYYILFSQIKRMISRVRQFGDLRQSRSSKKDNLSSSFSSRALLTPKSEISKASSKNSHYVCINCINQQLSSNKKCQNFQRDEAQKSRYLDLEKSRRAFEHDLAQSREKKQEEDKKKISDFNKNLIDSHQKQKLDDQRLKENARKKQEQDKMLHQKLIQQDLAKKQNAKNLFRNELQQQIQQKNEQKLRQQMKSRYVDPIPQDQNWAQLSKQQKQKYRQELDNQIRQLKQKKQRQRQNQTMMNLQQQNFLGDLIASNNKKQNQTENQIKKKLQEDEKEHKRQQQLKQKQKMQKFEQQKLQALINQQFMQKQQQQNEVMKNDRINRYKRDIEQQIKENEQRRNKLTKAQKISYYASIGMTKEEIQRKLCDSCEKTYPKKYMTKVKHK